MLLSCGPLQFGSAQPRHPTALSTLDDGQAIGVLDLGTHSGEGPFGLPGVHPAAINPDQRRRDVYVLVAGGARSVTDCHPRGRLQSLTLEPDGLDSLVGDFRPLVVGQLEISGREREREVPDVPVGGIGSIGVMGGIECCTQVCDLGRSQGPPLLHSHHDSRRDHPLIGVLVRPARPEEVADEIPAACPLGDLGDHGGLSVVPASFAGTSPPAAMPRIAAACSTARTARPRSSNRRSRWAGRAWLAFAHFVIWLRLFATPFKTTRVARASTAAWRRVAALSAEPDSAASTRKRWPERPAFAA